MGHRVQFFLHQLLHIEATHYLLSNFFVFGCELDIMRFEWLRRCSMIFFWLYRYCLGVVRLWSDLRIFRLEWFLRFRGLGYDCLRVVGLWSDLRIFGLEWFLSFRGLGCDYLRVVGLWRYYMVVGNGLCLWNSGFGAWCLLSFGLGLGSWKFGFSSDVSWGRAGRAAHRKSYQININP